MNDTIICFFHICKLRIYNYLIPTAVLNHSDKTKRGIIKYKYIRYRNLFYCIEQNINPMNNNGLQQISINCNSYIFLEQIIK